MEQVDKKTPKKRHPGQFDGSKPGPGRPKGAVNKNTAEMKALVQAHTPDVIAELVRLALHARSEMVRKMAIDSLLDRGYGRPKQEVDVTSNGETMNSGVLVVPGVMSEEEWEKQQ